MKKIMRIKNITQRGLPSHHNYEVVGIIYTSIENGKSVCENCGKWISTAVSLKDENEMFHYVDMNCLETIQQIHEILNGEEWNKYEDIHKTEYHKAKQLRSKILKGRKKFPDYIVNIHEPEGKDYFGFNFSNGNDPLGWDYSFNIDCKYATLSFIEDLI